MSDKTVTYAVGFGNACTKLCHYNVVGQHQPNDLQQNEVNWQSEQSKYWHKVFSAISKETISVILGHEALFLRHNLQTGH